MTRRRIASSTGAGNTTTDAMDAELTLSPGAAIEHRRLRLASRAAAVWAFLYGLYRAYYAAGGQIGMFGEPTSEAQWRLVNGVGATILLAAAITPLGMLVAWRHRSARPALFVVCWIVAVGCIMHALVDMTQRVMSLTGHMTLDHPFWSSIDRRQADLQDLLFNEPWFLVEGLLWASVGWFAGIGRGRHVHRWLASGLIAVAALMAIGLLSATGVIGKVVVG